MAELDALKTVADLMCLAARTAPKTGGLDVILAKTLRGQEKDRIAEEMDRIAREAGQAWFTRDADNLRASPVCLLLGAKSQRLWQRLSLNLGAFCGFCGFADCAANEAAGAVCAFNQIDLGIAASSAAAVAALHHADCRMMYTVGTAARRLDLFGQPVVAAIGIPLSGTGKNPFFDRKPPKTT